MTIENFSTDSYSSQTTIRMSSEASQNQTPKAPLNVINVLPAVSLSVFAIIVPVFVLIYKTMKLRIRKQQRQQEIASERKDTTLYLESVDPSFTGEEDRRHEAGNFLPSGHQHIYEDISSAHSESETYQPIDSGESDHAEDEYLTPI